jgi:hypothetical protein
MPVITRPTYIELNSIPLATPAWEVNDLSELLDVGRVRGSDVVMPGARGARPFRRRHTVVTRTLPMIVFGEKDIEGAAVADPVQGAINHMLYLADNLGIGIAGIDGDGTVDLIWHLPDATVLTAVVHVLGMIGTRDVAPGVLRTTIDLSFPDGGFVEVGS